MKAMIAIISAILMTGLVMPYATAETIPAWVKNNAGWWAEGQISQSDFVSGLQYLIQNNILKVPTTQSSEAKSDKVPDWVKNSAMWWAEGQVTDTEFVNSVQYLMKIGLISVTSSETSPTMEKSVQTDSSLEAELKECEKITRAYDRLKCEDAVKVKIMLADYKANAEIYEVGPITFYFKGANLEVRDSGQANLDITMLAENTGSNDNVILMCTGPSICNYDIWDGEKAFKYSSTDFTSGQTAIRAGEAREINLFFGPNIGYGGTTFEYDPTKEYFFRISEPWGSFNIPLELK